MAAGLEQGPGCRGIYPSAPPGFPASYRRVESEQARWCRNSGRVSWVANLTRDTDVPWASGPGLCHPGSLHV